MKILVRVVITGSLLLPMFLVACSSDGEVSISPEIQNKLNPVLIHLYELEKDGDAQEYATQIGITLVDGDKVRVNVTYRSEDKNKVVRAVKNIGEAEVVLESEMQVLVPLSKLITLAKITSIIFVDRPETGDQAGNYQEQR